MKFCGGEDVCVDLMVTTLCRSVPWRYLNFTPSQHWHLLVRFEVLTVMLLMIQILWDVTLAFGEWLLVLERTVLP